MINVNENVSFSATISENDENGSSVPIIDVNVALTKDTNDFNINFRVINQEASQKLLASNTASIQAQFDSFLNDINIKMKEYGYKITIK